ncbi:hypothetical protein HYR99_28220 [Candidatus Poribacteria bacterium]|nr:hypothetical protein [Candidatus Poribacteria bacterium]
MVRKLDNMRKLLLQLGKVHLTEDEILDYCDGLLKDDEEPIAIHLERCFPCRDQVRGIQEVLSPSTEQLTGVITIVRKLVGKGLAVVENLGAQFGPPRWIQPQWVPAMRPVRGEREEEISEAERLALTLPIHTEHANIELKVQPRSQSEFQVTLTLTTLAESKRGVPDCIVRWLMDDVQKDEVTTLSDGVAPFRVGYGNHEFRIRIEDIGNEIVVQVRLVEGQTTLK